MAFKGSLQDIALPDILQLISAQGMRGVLTLTRGAERLRIQVIDGRAICADTNLRPLAQRAATTLVSAGRLTRDQLQRALKAESQGKARLSKVLVDLELVPAEVVRRCFTVHYQQMIYNVLRWHDGNYDFERCDVTSDEPVDAIGFQNLLMSGMQMIDEWPMVESRIRNREAIVHRVSKGPGGDSSQPLDLEGTPAATTVPELSELAAEVLAQVDGKSTIQVIIDRTLQLEFDVCRALYDLMELGLVTMAFEGKLNDVGLPELLHAVRCSASSGQVELRSDDGVVSIWLKQGDMVAASSSDPDDGLGPYLLRSGVISRADLEAAIASTSADQVGAWLVQRGRVTPEVFDRSRLEQMTELIASRFPRRDGSYRFIPGNANPEAIDALAPLTPAIVMQGIRAVSRWSRLAAAVGDGGTEYRYNPSRNSPAWSGGLPPDQRAVLERFTDGQTVASARQHSDRTDYAMHQLVWWGRILGVLDGPPLTGAPQLFLAALSGNQQITRSTDVDDLFPSFQPAVVEARETAAGAKATAPTTAPVAAVAVPSDATADSSFQVDFTDMLRPRDPDVPLLPSEDAEEAAVALDELGDLADLLPDELPPEPPRVPARQQPPPRAKVPGR